MSLESQLQKRPDERILRASLSPQQSAEYIERQLAFIETLFGPILSVATQKTLTPHQIFDLYVNNNSGCFSSAYLRFLQQPQFSGNDPTYDAGIAILMRTYAQLTGINETQAGQAFLDEKIFEAYDARFKSVYQPLVDERMAKRHPEFARAI